MGATNNKDHCEKVEKEKKGKKKRKVNDIKVLKICFEIFLDRPMPRY